MSNAGNVATATEVVSDKIFGWVHRNHLLYNTCWEDPAIDRLALQLSARDRLLVITSAGCNALDYLLAGCGEVHAVDLNPAQNALLELKKVMATTVDFGDFNDFFGRGRHRLATRIYQRYLRWKMSEGSRRYWDKHIDFFSGRGWRDSFYYRGSAGLLAKFLMSHLFHVKDLRQPLQDLIEADSLERQSSIYHNQIRSRLWTRWTKWLVSSKVATHLMGVPHTQRDHMTTAENGVSGYIEKSLEAVFTQLPFRDNYFYRVYIEGEYPEESRPEYLKEHNYNILRERMTDLSITTQSVAGVLEEEDYRYSRFVLLDHMDWMSARKPADLVREWNAILTRATSNARVIFRSAAPKVTYLNGLEVSYRGGLHRLGSLLRYEQALADALHSCDRVHTYASFGIVSLPS